jgi:glucose-1-phosphate cytidylyltransferase
MIYITSLKNLSEELIMKVVILAGGYGTRLSEETEIKPKPMVEIGGKPILWHIMKIYSNHGYNDFIICLGYKGYIIKDYFHHYYLHSSNVILDLTNNSSQYLNTNAEPWRITLIDTGLDAKTGNRLKAIKDYVNNETFMLTYGDGVSNIDIRALVDFHHSHNKLATVTSVQSTGRFGALDIGDAQQVRAFKEKPKKEALINGGFFVLEPQIFDYIDEQKNVAWERDPLERLAQDNELMAYNHDGFWKPMDTLRDKRQLERLWQMDKPPWKIW